VKDTDGNEYVEIIEYPNDPFWRIGTLHFDSQRHTAESDCVGEVIRHGRDPACHAEFAQLVVLSETTGIPLEDADYAPLILGEGPVLRFGDGSERWYHGEEAAILVAITGDDPASHWRKKNPE
jgi:hypothetical protein